MIIFLDRDFPSIDSCDFPAYLFVYLTARSTAIFKVLIIVQPISKPLPLTETEILSPCSEQARHWSLPSAR